ncbi:MAG TPA: hypothetical protein VE907_11215 [Gammaproteobacteria bacterium]|nr:hypothetical protein [Gammaproteobacteria bacterium]
MRLTPHAGIFASADWLAEISGAHRTTVERWQRTQRLPRAVALLIRIMLEGELELVHPDWAGFRLDRRDGTLWTPEAWPARPADVTGIKHRMAQIGELERELGRARSVAIGADGRARELARALELVDELADRLRLLGRGAREPFDAVTVPPLPAAVANPRNGETNRSHEPRARGQELRSHL